MRLMTYLFAGLLQLSLATGASAATAVFAGGCFWCMESAYQDVEGVTDVVSGFTGGTAPNPSYKGDHSGHYEAVLVSYDPEVISYQAQLALIWKNVDTFDAVGPMVDRGERYCTGICVAGEGDRQQALSARSHVAQRFADRNVVTEVLDRAEFYPVEEAHQDYYLKNPVRYKYYRYRCGRDARLEEIWGSAVAH